VLIFNHELVIIGHCNRISLGFGSNFNSFTEFGYLFNDIETEINSWNFEFEIHHASVFDNGITELGGLYEDCDKIPMLKVGTEWDKLPDHLDSSDELRNIYFKVIV